MQKLTSILIIFSFFVLSCTRTNGTPKNAVLFENFEGKEHIGWTGTPTRINANSVLALNLIDNKYFGVGAWYKPNKPILTIKDYPVVTFSCFCGGTKSIYISFYNESQKDNFHYTWRGIAPHLWQKIEIPFSWFSDNENNGKTLHKGDLITKLNFFAGTPSQKPLIYIDDVAIVIKKGSAESAEFQPIFSQSFESNSQNWIGNRVSNLPDNQSGWALKAVPIENKYFGMKASYEPSRPFYRIEKDILKKPILTFSYYVSKKTQLYISLFDPVRNDNFNFEVNKPVIGKWTTVSRNLLTLNDNSYRGVRIRKGDLFSNLRFFVGSPGTNIDVFIDNVKIESKATAKHNGFDLTKRSFVQYIRINRHIIAHMRKIYSDKNIPKSIMTLGDSISESMAFVAPLRINRDGMLLGQGYKYIDKTICAKKRMQSIWGTQIIKNALSKTHPETVTILFGTNDILLGGKPGMYLANMEYIINTCLKNGSVPILLTIPPTTRKPIERIEKFNYQLRKLAEEKQIPLIDIYRLFRDQPKWQSLLSDGVHPNYFENNTTVGGYNLINDIVFETYKFLEKEVMKRASVTPDWFVDSFNYSLPTDAQIVFKFDFNATKQGWTGTHKPAPDKPTSNKCIKLLKKQELEARIGSTFRVLPTTYIAVSCYAMDCPRIRVQLYNKTQKDNFWTARERIPQRKWTTFYFDLNREFQDNENKDKQIQFQDLINTIQVYAPIISGKSMLYIDNFIVFNATQKSFTHTLQSQFNILTKNLSETLFDSKANDPLVKKISNLQNQIKLSLSNLSIQNIAKLNNSVEHFENLIKKLALKNKMRTVFTDISPAFAIGYASPMRRISPYKPELPFVGSITNTINIFSAQNETERFQLYLEPFSTPINSVSLSISDLVNQDKNDSISAKNISWFKEGYVTTRRSWPIPLYRLGTKPDPLIPGTPFDLTDPITLWISVYVPPGKKAGLYHGTIRIESKTAPIIISLNIHVWNFELPITGRLRTPTTFDLGILKDYYGHQPTQTDRRKWYSFLLKHRIDPTSLYHFGLYPPIDDIEFCSAKGIRTFVLGGHHYSDSIIQPAKIQHYYEIIKKKGILDKTLIYIGDETGASGIQNLKKKADWIHTNCPGLKTFAGINPRPELFGYIDVWDPIITGMRFNDWNQKISAKRQSQGDQVMWYVAASPSFPYPNVQIDNQLIEARILFWMTWKYHIDGWEYYYCNLWADNIYGRGDKKWPDVPWDTYSFQSGNSYNGDGMLVYPGKNMTPYPSMRLENITDGIEDYEMLNILSEYTDKAKSIQPRSDKLNNLIEQAQSILAVPSDIVQDIAHYTRNTDALSAIRNKTGVLIENLKKQLHSNTADKEQQ